MIIGYNIFDRSCTTPCPHNEQSDTGNIILVGSVACADCKYYGRNYVNLTILCLKDNISLPLVDNLPNIPSLR